MQRPPSSALALCPLFLLLAAPSPATAAHDDDPKILDRRPPHRGKGYRSAATRDAAGNVVLESPPSIFTADGVSLLAWLPVDEFGAHQNANDCWGYVSPAGREYALLGLSGGTAFVDVTSPGNPVTVDVFDGPGSLWRDVKVHGHHAYAVSEGGGGIQVFDLSQIDSGVIAQLSSVTSPGTKKTHNVAVDTTSGFLYRCGGGNEGLRIYDLSNPAAPAFVGSWTDRYVHDAQVVTYTEGPYAGRQIAFCCTGFDGGVVDPGLHVLDVTDKQDIVQLAHLSYSVPGYSHQAWLSEDRQTLFLNDEFDESAWGKTATHVIDVSDLSNPVDLGVFLGETTSIGHNLYTLGELVFEANYTSGLRVYDAGDPLEATEIAYYDTWHLDDAQTFNGLWSVHPYLPSGTILGSDIEKGLFVWSLGDPPLAFQHPDGLPAPVAPEGQALSVVVTESAAGDLVPGSVTLHYETGHESGAGAASVPMTAAGNGLYEASLPPLPCGSPVRYYFSAEAQDGVVWRSPEGAPGAAVVTTAATAETVLLADDAETHLGIWQTELPGDTATKGMWTRGVPAPTDAQPGTDVTLGGKKCHFTGNAAIGQPIGFNDVDGGVTTLELEPFDLDGATEVMVDYWRWYSNDQGEVADDTFAVRVSNDGVSWVEVESLGPGHPEASGGWYFHSFRLRDFVEPTADVQIRFVASDLGGASIVEAAIDEFRIREVLCGDCNGNGVSDEYELEEGLAQDLDGDGKPDDCDPLWADTLELSLSAGGTQTLSLDAGDGEAGELYWLLGSLSGTEPGLPLGSAVLPLNADAYLDLTLAAPNTPPLGASFGVLDAEGRAQATFTLAPGTNPGFAGLVLHHAYLVADAAAEVVALTSNPVPLALLP